MQIIIGQLTNTLNFYLNTEGLNESRFSLLASRFSLLALIALGFLIHTPLAFSQSWGGWTLQCYTGTSTGYGYNPQNTPNPSPQQQANTSCIYVPAGGGGGYGGSGGTGGSGGSGSSGGTEPVATVIPVGGTGQVRTNESCSASLSIIRQAAREGAAAALGREPVDGDLIKVFSDAQDSENRTRTFKVAGTQFVDSAGSCGVSNSGGGGGGGGGGYIP